MTLIPCSRCGLFPVNHSGQLCFVCYAEDTLKQLNDVDSDKPVFGFLSFDAAVEKAKAHPGQFVPFTMSPAEIVDVFENQITMFRSMMQQPIRWSQWADSLIDDMESYLGDTDPLIPIWDGTVPDGPLLVL